MPATEQIAITSATFLNEDVFSTPAHVDLAVFDDLGGADCNSATVVAALLEVALQPNDTVHMDFPEPLIASGTGTWCLGVDQIIAKDVRFTVVGYTIS
jgi:hypothetical protein